MATMTETLPNHVHVFKANKQPGKTGDVAYCCCFPHLADFYDLPLPGRDEWSLFEHRDNQPKSTEDRYSVKTAAFASLSKQPAVMELLYDLKVLACSSAIPPSSG